MTSLPIFLTCVANSADEASFPLLFTWSTPDLQIKEVLIIPDDDWLHHANIESNLCDIDENQLYEFGYEASDILAEWTAEFDTDFVLALDTDLVGSMVEATFDAKGMDPSFEVVSAHRWFSDRDVDLHYELTLLDLSQAVELLPPDEQIAILLRIAHSKSLIDLPEAEQDDLSEHDTDI
ncbi:hypothetical protein OA92_04645 [Marinomonas sp. SBI22]|uniref:hypothetical protein n=1 Tax=unclassified Marinomonas TaxID=196814 RepID=UPI0007AF0F2D|nr:MULTISPECIES: hypothetical protein [unclassified Marinomonas]KZM45137.1 hypothetical protein OA92_04645 [Marinomonas sp. SBI22]KZM46835.1 hypothetical protein OA91_03700 [Marinomonas sp. SBI8L]